MQTHLGLGVLTLTPASPLPVLGFSLVFFSHCPREHRPNLGFAAALGNLGTSLLSLPFQTAIYFFLSDIINWGPVGAVGVVPKMS